MWTGGTVTAYASVDSSLSKALDILESLLHFTGVWVERHHAHSLAYWQTLVATCGRDREMEENEKFSFLKPTGHSEKKETDALAHDPGCPPLPPNKDKNKTKPSPQIKTNSEPSRMASTKAPTPQVVMIDRKDGRNQACYFSVKYKCKISEHNLTGRE